MVWRNGSWKTPGGWHAVAQALGAGSAVLDGVQKSIAAQARAVSICLGFARRVINGKELEKPQLKELVVWRHDERKKKKKKEILMIAGTAALVN